MANVATRRLPDRLNSPSSSSKLGKSWVCKTWVDCVICCRRLSFIWASGVGCLVDSNSLTPRGPPFKHNRTVLFYFNNFT